MKKILITGRNSYIGNSFDDWVKQSSDKYYVEKVSLRADDWSKQSWSEIDVVLHVAGIVHDNMKGSKKKQENLHYKINSELTYSVAKKAKKDGVKHFIFISTMSVYGKNTGKIESDTPLLPNNAYGKSKLKGENLIQSLEEPKFTISIIRPPMVYGKNAPGNYSKLAKLAKITPLFPDIDNKRSMIFIDNLSMFIEHIIGNQISGIHLPQNKEYVNVKEMVGLISKLHNHKIRYTSVFNSILTKLNNNQINKVVGDLYYEKKMSFNKYEAYNGILFEESIKLSEKIDK